MDTRPLAVVLATVVLCGCATAPEKVRPISAVAGLYNGADCQRLDGERRRLDLAYQSASDAQLRTRKVDAVGLILLGLPVGRLTGGDKAKAIGTIKGQQEALSEAYRVSNCAGA